MGGNRPSERLTRSKVATDFARPFSFRTSVHLCVLRGENNGHLALRRLLDLISVSIDYGETDDGYDDKLQP